MLRSLLPDAIVNQILSIPLNINENDQILFKTATNGPFSIKEVWNDFRIIKESSRIFANIWHNNIPMSYSILTWRCLKGFLPVDVRLLSKGFSMPSKCHCCADIENIKHVFLFGKIAQKVWRYYALLVNKLVPDLNSSDQVTVLSVLTEWMSNVRGNVLNLLPIFILLLLWKPKNEAKHDGIKMKDTVIITNINHRLFQSFNAKLITTNDMSSCQDLCVKLGINIHFEDVTRRERIVRWLKPKAPAIKLNSDGSVDRFSTGFGGIIRDSFGEVIVAYASPLSPCMVIFAELMGLLYPSQRLMLLVFLGMYFEIGMAVVQLKFKVLGMYFEIGMAVVQLNVKVWLWLGFHRYISLGAYLCARPILFEQVGTLKNCKKSQVTMPNGVWGVPPSNKGDSVQGLSGSSSPASRSFRDVLTGTSSSLNPVISFSKSTVKGVPALLMSEDDILKLASPYQFTLVGKFTATANRSRPSVARVLVEIDITKKHPKEIWIGSDKCGYLQKVDYEKVLDFCLHCKIHGHAIQECFVAHPHLKKQSEGIPKKVDLVVEGITKQGNLDMLEGQDATHPNFKPYNKEVDTESTMLEAHINTYAVLEKDLEDNNGDIRVEDELHQNVSSGNAEDDMAENKDEEFSRPSSNSKDGDKHCDISKKCNNADSTSKEPCITKDSGKDVNLMEKDDDDMAGKVDGMEEGEIGSLEIVLLIDNLSDLNDEEVSIPNYKRKNVEEEIFVQSFSIDIISDFPQVVHVNVNFNHISVYASFVYASCTRTGRKILWELLHDFCSTISAPWLVGGDFNCITNNSERIGGNSPHLLAMEDFNDMILNCNLHDIGFLGNNFTWNRGTMWQRLDRILFNDRWISTFHNTHIEHLSRTLSDHSPLLLNVSTNSNAVSQPFRFQNMWLLDDRLENIIRCNWDAPLHPNDNVIGMNRLWFKLKRLKQPLRWWNKNIFKNIFSNIKLAENEVDKADRMYMSHSTDINLSALNNAKNLLANLQEKEEAFWKQKASVKFLVEGDRNTSYFHNIANHNKISRNIHKLITPDGEEISNQDLIAASGSNFFENIFNSNFLPNLNTDFYFMPSLITNDDNLALNRIPNEEEILISIKDMNTDSVAGPDGFTNKFFQKFWPILKNDIINAVKDFFEGNPMPKFFTSTTIVLIPKTVGATYWNEFRPISLCTFFNKLISKILVSRMAVFLPKIISLEQTGFVKGRSIFDNVLLAQEIIHDLNAKISGGNVIFKMDISKAYDNLNWKFLYKIMHLFGFNSQYTNLIKHCIENSYFSVLINGKAQGFFKSSNGIRQGDPLSPALFIIAAEFLSRASGLTFNYTKCAFIPAKTISATRIGNISRRFGIHATVLPIKYLGVPLYKGKKRKKGLVIVSKCQCCYHFVNINHVFINGPIAIRVWNYFDNIFKVMVDGYYESFTSIIKDWIIPIKGHIRNTIPVLICWYLWASRNDSKHNNIRMDAMNIISKVKNKVIQLYNANLIKPSSFKNHYNAASAFGLVISNRKIKSREKLIYWKRPVIDYFKLNTDGSYNSVTAGCAGIIRDHNGKIVVAFAGPSSGTYAITAEIDSLNFGVKLCQSLGFTNIWIEVDALLLIQYISGNSSYNPTNFYKIREIKLALSGMNYSISHILREGNAVADALAKLGCNLDCFYHFNDASIPRNIKGLINLDRMGLPYMRSC
ncbi:hypothetical protein KFK09_011737 [Dendrobium nobile]|uniref:Reverse transcriptase domain-containing protein n=1 Tax=Dendrobium nobile TaxID=94219 RepID=A0A8T3BFE9_DENNO|nr:hypothetical protein KFK09_011737 [Dendrobium nobile]